MIKRCVLISFILVFLFPACDREPRFDNFSPTIVWKSNQSEISTISLSRNQWSGFSVDRDFFVSRLNRGMFIIWRLDSEEKELSIGYRSAGKPVELLFNRAKIDLLPPSSQLTYFNAQVKTKKGFNFIEFRKMKKNSFRIRSIKIKSSVPEPSFHLTRGGEMIQFHDRGNGFLRFRGNGRLHIRKVELKNGEMKADEKFFKSGFISTTKKFQFRFDSFGFIKITCSSGKYNIIDYQFLPLNPKKERSVPFSFPPRMPVFIFLIDGCQASHLKCFGYHRNTSPTIDSLAKEGTVFLNAYANATFTRSSVASLFTGYYPQRHKLRILSNILPENLFLMAEFFKMLNYRTAVFTEAGNISEVFGFSQGVDSFKRFAWMERHQRFRPGAMFRQYCSWIEPNSLLFSYVHFRAPHLPILPPPQFLDIFKGQSGRIRGERVISRLTGLLKKRHPFSPEEIQDVVDDYDSSIRYVDFELGKYIHCLKQRNLYDSAMVIFTSDHGEAMHEHGAFGHGLNVYEETSRVPLIVKFPREMNLTGRVNRVVQLIDIFPTLAEIFGLDRNFDGESLMRSIRKDRIDDRFAVSVGFTESPSYGIRWRNWYYIIHTADNREELFNLETNPLRDVSKTQTDLIDFFKAKFLSWAIEFDNLKRVEQEISLKRLPEDVLHNLKSLGYID